MTEKCMTAAMSHVLCDAKLCGLTKIPAVNAPNAPTMESYGRYDKVIPSVTLGAILPDG